MSDCDRNLCYQNEYNDMRYEDCIGTPSALAYINYHEPVLPSATPKTNKGEWIETEKQMPPKGQWVLVAQDNYQKPWEIMTYMGVQTGYKYLPPNFDEKIPYSYHAWTSGHGDITSKNPVAWMPLPDPYKQGDEE